MENDPNKQNTLYSLEVINKDSLFPLKFDFKFENIFKYKMYFPYIEVLFNWGQFLLFIDLESKTKQAYWENNINQYTRKYKKVKVQREYLESMPEIREEKSIILKIPENEFGGLEKITVTFSNPPRVSIFYLTRKFF